MCEPIYIGFLAFTTFDLVNNLVGILYIIFNVFLYTVVVFLVNGKNESMNEWMSEWMNEWTLYVCEGEEKCTTNFSCLELFLIDIDECMTNTHNCDIYAVCNNTDGFHNCTCKPGFSGDGSNCTGNNVSLFFICLWLRWFLG